jgi:DNA polymerase-3 subunit delta
VSFQAFQKEVDKGLPSPIYFFHAQDPFLYREAVAAIRGLVPPAERDFNLHVFDLSVAGDDPMTLAQLLDVANTASFFGGRRFTLFMVNPPKILKKDVERLNAYVSDPSPDSVFVMLYNGVLSKDAREKFKALKPLSLDIRESEIPHWIKQRGRLKGLEISDEASDYLIGLIGPDLGLLSSEIEKISLIGKQSIGVDEIAEIATGARLYSIFDLVDALRERDAEKVFTIYKTLRETAEDYSLIGALNWQYARKMHPRINPAENEYLLGIFELFNKADIDIKSSGRTFPMEYLLIKLLRLKAGRP